MRIVVWACVASLAAGGWADAQDAFLHSDSRVSIEPRVTPPPDSGRTPRIRVDSTLVLINVTVLDPLNRLVTGLEREHFRLFEDHVEQEIENCSMSDAPASVGLVFDVSGSMKEKLGRARQAAAAFLQTANPRDEFFLVIFSDRAKLAAPCGGSPEEILNRLAFTSAKGRTALLDAVYLALDQMRSARHPRKALLVLSDGADNSSRYSAGEVRKLVRESDVQIYSIGIFESFAVRGRTPEEIAGPGLLAGLAQETGGRDFEVRNISELPDIAAKIGNELRNQYELAYRPSNGKRDGRYRRVQVKLTQPRGLPDLRLHWRTGYYAPAW
mgnify:CR=1 FL=1